jgi:hypothetical protein
MAYHRLLCLANGAEDAMRTHLGDQLIEQWWCDSDVYKGANVGCCNE